MLFEVLTFKLFLAKHEVTKLDKELLLNINAMLNRKHLNLQ